MAGRRTAGAALGLLAVLVVLWTMSVGTVGGVGTGPTASDATVATASQPAPDTATTRITVYPNGTAVWSVEIRTALTNETDRADYRRFQAAFENDTDRYLGPFRERMTRLVGTASDVTGRPMAAEEFAASTRIQQTAREWGVVEYRFRWEGFAATENETVVVGDVFESGYYLAAGDSLVLEAPAGYRIADASPDPARRETGRVRWRGPLDFADRRPAVRFVPGDTATGTDAATVTATDATDGPTTDAVAESAGGSGPLGPLLAGLTLVLLVGGAYAAVRRGRSAAGTAGGTDDGDAAAAADDAGATAAGAAGDAADALVTDEERVVELLAENDGRMRQADIADRLDWSAPKTSRVLSDMAEDGTVEKLRLGNENVIDLQE